MKNIQKRSVIAAIVVCAGAAIMAGVVSKQPVKETTFPLQAEEPGTEGKQPDVKTDAYDLADTDLTVWYEDPSYEDFFEYAARQYFEQTGVKAAFKCQDTLDYIGMIYDNTMQGEDYPDVYLLNGDELEEAYLYGLAMENEDGGSYEGASQKSVKASTYEDKMIGYLKNDVGISLVDTESEKPVGIINDYISLVSGYLGEQAIEFQLTGFESQEKELQALKDNRIDMIFHMNQNPYEAEQNDIVLSNTVFEINVAVLTGVKKFDENKENTVAVSRNNLLGKWYISFNYPFWKIKEYDSSAEADKAVQSGEADCFVVKAGQSLKTLEDSKMRSIFLTKSGASCFAVTRENTTLMNILNKTIQTLPASRLSSQFYVYENAPGKVTLAEYIKDNLRVVSIWFVSVVLIIVWIIVYLLIQARKAKIQAEKANAAKSEFLFNMSHDIRTPMNALLGYSELIKRELTDPKLLDYQEKMEQSGNLLLSIINNVLDMARIESGKVELDEDYVKIRDIYQGIYKIFQAEAEKKCIHLKMEYDVKHEHVICDETKNKEIFLNLISNAVKYTASGGRVTIRITELDCDRKDYVRIRTQVIDTGIGMSEEFLPSLFEAFARERNTTDGKIAGTGLGMPIIKKYIDMMYGTIEVESKQGEGSKFTVTLEYRIADKSYYEQDTEKSSDVDETDRISGKHILLAEDNDLNAEIAQFILEDMGLMVDRVEDGVQCVSRIEQKPAGTYDLILMDIQMPNMDGYRATEMIRGLSDKDKATIPIIAMTANAFEEDRKKALAKGMNGHIAKPVDAEKVEKTICSVLGSQSEQ